MLFACLNPAAICSRLPSLYPPHGLQLSPSNHHSQTQVVVGSPKVGLLFHVLQPAPAFIFALNYRIRLFFPDSPQPQASLTDFSLIAPKEASPATAQEVKQRANIIFIPQEKGAFWPSPEITNLTCGHQGGRKGREVPAQC